MSDRDNITLPREVVKLALEALEWSWGGEPMGTKEREAITALRTALAAEQPKPTDKDSLTVQSRLDAESFREERDEARALLNGVLQDIEALRRDAEQPKHPGYVIGSHWLETAYSRICAGEAEADVLRDCGWERVDDAEALRREDV